MVTRSARGALITGIAAGAIGLFVSIMPRMLEFEEAFALAALHSVRGPVDPPADVVIVSISRESAEALGLGEDLRQEVGLTGWPRLLHSDLVKALNAAGAKLIAFDIHFREPREASSDAQLAESIAAAGSVILFESIERSVNIPRDDGPGAGVQIISDQRIPPFPLLDSAARASAPFPLPEIPIRVYQYWAFAQPASDAPTLPIIAFQLYADKAHQEFVRLVRELRPGLSGEQIAPDIEALTFDLRRAFLNDRSIAGELIDALATDAILREQPDIATAVRSLIDLYSGPDGRYLNYYGAPQTIQTVPIHRILQDGLDPAIDWEGAAVFVGYSDRFQSSQRDQFTSIYTQRSGLSLSGVEIAATAFANLIENKTLRILTVPQQLVLVAIIGLLFGACYLLRSVLTASLLLGSTVLLYFAAAQLQFSYAGNIWPILIPVLIQAPFALFLGISLHYRRAQARQVAVSRGVSRYLPPDLVERIAENSGAATRASELTHGTCMVTDMEQFTAFAEGKSPRILETALNAYYDTLFGIVNSRHGLVTDIVGDSMVAVWQSVSGLNEENADAIRAAMEISTHMSKSDASFPRTRVGLHSGEFILGTVGAKEHLEYRAVGDVVNSASRVQALNKRLGTTILMTRESLRGAEVESREIGTFQLAGKEVALNVFEPICLDLKLSQDQEELISRFALALGEFREGNWEQAVDLFEALSEDMGSDGPSDFYVQYIRGRPASSMLTRQNHVIRFTD